MKTEQQVELAIDKYASEIRKICFIHCKNEADVDDISQSIFIKYYESDEEFSSEEHEKAWIIRVTINACHDIFRTWFRKNAVLTDDFSTFSIDPKQEDGRILEMVRKLKPNWRDAIYLFYYQEYSTKEIAKILNSNENTVSTWLKRGKEALKDMLGGDYFE